MVMWYYYLCVKKSGGYYHLTIPGSLSHDYAPFRFFHKMNTIVAYVEGIIDQLTVLWNFGSYIALNNDKALDRLRLRVLTMFETISLSRGK